jgi:DDE superfamily endonuclease
VLASAKLSTLTPRQPPAIISLIIQLKAEHPSIPEGTSRRVNQEFELETMALRCVDQAGILRLGLEKHNISYSTAESKQEQQRLNFRKFYGIEPKTFCEVLRDVQKLDDPHRIKVPSPYHLLMTLEWFRTYKTEFELTTVFLISESTVSKELWKYTRAIQALKERKIKWPWGPNGGADEEVFIVSVDGVHCTISEPRKMPSSKWFSHKTHGPAVGYEIAISLQQNRVVHVNGPYPAGVPDITIFQAEGGLKSKMPDGKFATADRGYRGKPKLRIPNNRDAPLVKEFKKRSQARHETFNARLKSFKILSTRFRHRHSHRGNPSVTCHDNHKAAFEAVCVLIQYDMENGHPLFAI